MITPFDPTHGLIVVPMRVWGPKRDAVARLALDTGATTTLIRTGILVLLGYDPATATERVQMTTGSGVEFAPRIFINRIEALGQRRSRFAVLGHTLPPTASIDGLLGLDFLRGRRLVIDFAKGEVSIGR